MREVSAATLGIALFAIVMPESVADARQFSYVRIVDTDSPVPEGSGAFGGTGGSVFASVNISDGNVVFAGDSGIGWGVYEYAGGVGMLVVRSGMPLPGANGQTFAYVDAPGVQADGSNVVFHGFGQTVSGIYSQFGPALGLIADTTMTPAGATGPFRQFGRFMALEKTTTVFNATTGPSSLSGLYARDNNVLATIADTSTQIPEGPGTFTFLYNPDIANGDTYFGGTRLAGQTYFVGVFKSSFGVLSRIVSTGDIEPRGMGTFVDATMMSADASSVLFRGDNSQNFATGLYRITGDTVSFIADTNTPAPGTGSMFRGFAFGDIEDGKAVFVDDLLHAVFTDASGTLEKIVGPGDLVDGRIVREAYFTPGGRDGNQVAVSIIFTTDTFMNPDQGVYVFTIPAPHSAAVVGAFGVVACRQRRPSARR